MTFSELRSEVFRRLRESSTNPTFWTVSDVETAINEGYAEISDASEWCEVERTVDLLALRPYYDLRTLWPDDTVLSVTAAFNEVTQRWLTPESIEDFDTRDIKWERVQGQPSHLMTRGLWWLRLWPMCAEDAGELRVKVTILPTPLSADDDTPGFAESLHEGLIAYALADLWMQDAEATLAVDEWKRYLAYEDALSGFTDGRLSMPLVRGLQVQ